MEPGILNISEDAYHADPCPTPSLSSGLARTLLARSPLHAWTASPRLNPGFVPVEKKTFDIGRAAHRAVLGKGGDFVAYPGDMLAANGAASTKAAKEWAEEQRAEGRTPLKAEEVDQIWAMAEAVTLRLMEYGITLDPAHSEKVAVAEIGGVWCRAMVDNAEADPRIPLYDLKTTEDASAEAVMASVTRYGYDIQAAHYLDTWKAATGEDRKFRFIFVEKSAPHEVAVVELYRKPGDEADWFDHAFANAAEARRIWGQCVASGHWPGYPRKVAILGAPAWHTAKQEARAAMRPAAPTQDALTAAAEWQAP